MSEAKFTYIVVHSENHTEYNEGFAFTQEPGRAREGTQAGSLGRGVLPRHSNHSQPALQMKLNSC